MPDIVTTAAPGDEPPKGGPLVPVDPKLTASMLESVIINGDLSKLRPEQRVAYYHAMCNAINVDARFQPFAFMTLKGKSILYALKSCAEQLRRIHGVSITKQESRFDEKTGLYVVQVEGRDHTGRTDTGTGAAPTAGLKGEDLVNALLKAETKAKRRMTLSICGLGMLDETEVDSIRGATPEAVDLETGEVKPTNGGEKSPRPSLAATMQRKPVAAQPVNPAPSESPSTVRPLQNAQTGLEGASCPSGQADLDYDALGPEPESYTPDEVKALDVIGREIERVASLEQLDELWRTHKAVRDRMSAEAAGELRARFKVRGDELKGNA